MTFEPMNPITAFTSLSLCDDISCDLDIGPQRNGLKLLNAGMDDEQRGTYPVDLLP